MIAVGTKAKDSCRGKAIMNAVAKAKIRKI